MPTPEQQAKLKALAAYFRGGGVPDQNIERGAMGLPDNTGNLSGAPRQPLPPVQNVPQWALHDPRQPDGHQGAGTMDQMAAVRAAQLQQNNLANSDPGALGQQPAQMNMPSDDMSGYSDYHPQAARQFPQIQKKIQSGQPVTRQDIQEMTPEKEAEMFPDSKKDKEEE